MDLVARVKGLLLEPQAEWRRIAAETHTTSGLLKNYVAVLAAIPAICGLIGSTLIGASLLASLLFAVLSYLLTFVAVLAEAMLIEALAPVFKSSKNFANAVKLAAFFPTAYLARGGVLCRSGSQRAGAARRLQLLPALGRAADPDARAGGAVSRLSWQAPPSARSYSRRLPRPSRRGSPAYRSGCSAPPYGSALR